MALPGSPGWFSLTLESLIAGRDLAPLQMVTLMEQFLQGGCGEAEIAALLVALRIKGETADELAAAAGVMRRYCQPLPVAHDVLDTCGTGGDGSGTFNISTATALVVAGAGVKVVKHGNRGISSRSGSADVLGELGVQTNVSSEIAQRCLDVCNLAFCLAPAYHPALKHVGEVRRRLGVRTLFNCMGPLANPARAGYQLLGVGRPEWLERMAGAVARLGIRRAFLVHSMDGLDEVSLSAPTQIREVNGERITALVWTGNDFGLPACELAALRVGDARESARVVAEVLAGKDGPGRNIVLANAAAALLVVGAADSLPAGVRLAASSIDSGRAAATLEALVKLSQGKEHPVAARGG